MSVTLNIRELQASYAMGIVKKTVGKQTLWSAKMYTKLARLLTAVAYTPLPQPSCTHLYSPAPPTCDSHPPYSSPHAHSAQPRSSSNNTPSRSRCQRFPQFCMRVGSSCAGAWETTTRVHRTSPSSCSARLWKSALAYLWDLSWRTFETGGRMFGRTEYMGR